MSEPELSISGFVNNHSQNTNIIKDIIFKYKITAIMSENDIKMCIIKYYLNNMFEQLIQNGTVNKDNDLYTFGDYKTSNKIDIINYIINDSTNKLNFKKIINCLYNSIIKDFELEQNNLKINQNDLKMNKIIKMNEILEKKKKLLRERIDTENSDKLETIYKQTRLETEMQTEIFQQEFQKTNISADYELINQAYTSQIQSKMTQIVQRQTQIQTENQNRLQQRHNIEILEQELLNAEITHTNEQAKIVEYNKANILQQEILNESIGLRADLNASFVKIIDVMNEQNKALITAIETASKSTQDVIDQTSKATSAVIKASSITIQESIRLGTQSVHESIKRNAESNIARLDHINRILIESNRQRDILNAKIDAILASRR